MARKGTSVAIIGAGVAGLCTGIYAQLNGYSSRIYELHDSPGGLCTAWKRKGYTIDFCIHWLVGSAPGNSLYRLWQEVGLIPRLEIVNLDEHLRFEGTDGRTVIMYTDLHRLEEHLLELSPADGPVIRDLMHDLHRLSGRDLPSDIPPRQLMNPLQLASAAGKMAPLLPLFRKWGKVTLSDFAARLTDPLLREFFGRLWWPDFSFVAQMVTMAWMNDGVAGYPIGGSMPLARALEKRYLELGGEIRYKARVVKILVEAGRAVGLRLEDGSEERAEAVLSAADGHATLFEMLGDSYVDECFRRYYRDYDPFPSLVFIGVGVNRSFDAEPKVIESVNIPLIRPLQVGPESVDRLSYHLHNYDPTLAPEGKTVLTVALESNHEYWTQLRADPAAYKKEKDRLANDVVGILDARFPGLADQVEMVDVATPATIARYTANWQGSFEGWLPTPANLTEDMPKTLPGLAAFYMAGQWVAPGGGLPSGVKTARDVVQFLCKADGRKFRTQAP